MERDQAMPVWQVAVGEIVYGEEGAEIVVMSTVSVVDSCFFLF